MGMKFLTSIKTFQAGIVDRQAYEIYNECYNYIFTIIDYFQNSLGRRFQN